MKVKRGSIYGFPDSNSLGKTTTVSLLPGLLNKQQGSMEVLGQELHSNRIESLKKQDH